VTFEPVFHAYTASETESMI